MAPISLLSHKKNEGDKMCIGRIKNHFFQCGKFKSYKRYLRYCEERDIIYL